jgi:hypothetical protein
VYILSVVWTEEENKENAWHLLLWEKNKITILTLVEHLKKNIDMMSAEHV